MVQTTLVQFVILGVGFINSLFLARLLGPAGRGEFAAVQIWPQALAILGILGIQEACVYYAARPQLRSGVVMTNAFALSLVQAPLLMVIGYFLLPYLLARQSAVVIAASRTLLIIMPMGFVGLYGNSVLRAKLDMGLYNAISLIIPCGNLIGVIWLAMTHRLFLGTFVALQVLLYVTLLLATLAALVLRRRWDCFTLDVSVMKQMLVYGVKVQLGQISQVANLRLDQMLMAALLPPAELGLYVVAVSIASTGVVIPSVVRMLITPRLAQSETPLQDKEGLQNRLRLYWSINVATGLALLLLAPMVIAFVFGPQFIPAILPTEILIVASICLGGKDILAGTAYGLGTPVLVSQAELVSLIVTAVGLVLLLPLWGIVGAAVVSVAAYVTSLLFLSLRMRLVHQISSRAVLLLGWHDVHVLIGFARRFLSGLYRRSNHTADTRIRP